MRCSLVQKEMLRQGRLRLRCHPETYSLEENQHCQANVFMACLQAALLFGFPRYVACVSLPALFRNLMGSGNLEVHSFIEMGINII